MYIVLGMFFLKPYGHFQRVQSNITQNKPHTSIYLITQTGRKTHLASTNNGERKYAGNKATGWKYNVCKYLYSPPI